MSLSIEKFQQFIEPFNFVITKHFLIDQKCLFIECCSINTGELIMCKIPDSYNFQLTNTNFVSLTSISFQEGDTKEEDVSYYTPKDEMQIEQQYSDLTLQHGHTISTINKVPMREHLHSIYKHKVLLKDIEATDKIILKNIQRQLDRLKYCIQGLQHKLMVIHSGYLGYLTLDDQVQLFSSNLEKSQKRELRIVIDLKVFIDKINSIEHEIIQINKGLFEILNKNQKTHIKNMKQLMEQRESLIDQSEYLFDLKNEMANRLEKFTLLLNENNDLIKEKNTELHHIITIKVDNMHQDMKMTHQKQNITKQINKLTKIQHELLKIIHSLKQEYSNVGLIVDTVLFNNIIMLDQIFKNLKEFENLKIKEK